MTADWGMIGALGTIGTGVASVAVGLFAAGLTWREMKKRRQTTNNLKDGTSIKVESWTRNLNFGDLKKRGIFLCVVNHERKPINIKGLQFQLYAPGSRKYRKVNLRLSASYDLREVAQNAPARSHLLGLEATYGKELVFAFSDHYSNNPIYQCTDKTKDGGVGRFGMDQVFNVENPERWLVKDVMLMHGNNNAIGLSRNVINGFNRLHKRMLKAQTKLPALGGPK